MELESNVIDLATLENLPDPALINVLSNLDPKSLVRVCQSSSRIRSFCKYVWKSLFKRDITKKEVCNNPNWKKLYQIAVTVEFPVYALDYGHNEYVVKAMENIPEARTIGNASLRKEITTALKDSLDYSKKEIVDFFKSNNIKNITDKFFATLFDADEGEDFFVGVKLLGNMRAAEIMDADEDDDYIIYTIKTPEDWQKSELEEEFGYDIINVDVSRAILGLDRLKKELTQILRDKFNLYSIEIEEFFKYYKDELDDFKKGPRVIRVGESLGTYLQLEGDIAQTGEHFVLILEHQGEDNTDISVLKKFFCSM